MLRLLVPEEASTLAVQTDRIFAGLLVLALVIILLVLTLVLTFAIRYRAGSKAERGELPEIFKREFEIGWTAATLFVFVFLFWWAASAQLSALVPPPGSLEVHVLAKQWMWKTQHANGVREINELHVPVDLPVRLVMTSEDAIHSFFVPAFRLKQDVLPGRTTETSFTATKPGTYHLFCAEFCGTDHSRMLGRVVVMPQEEFARWLSAQPEGESLAQQGKSLFVARGCAGCHAESSTIHAPRLAGVYGHPVPLSSGHMVTADEAYIRDSILQPTRDVVAGYQPIMPSFAGVLSESEIQALVAYIRSLAAPAPETAPVEGSGSLVPAPPAARSPAMVPGATARPAPGGKP
ncbi:MAG: cytochrome c oxidase subunit II [Xanthobacteraceae bacterium]